MSADILATLAAFGGICVGLLLGYTFGGHR